MTYTLESLMAAVGCKKWPERWNEIFDEAMTDFDKNGCPLLVGDYYDNLHKKYGVLNKYLDLYKDVAEKVSKNEPLSRLLMLLCYTVKERKTALEDLRSFERPKATNPDEELEYEMLCALPAFYPIDYCYELLSKRNLPKEVIDRTLNTIEGGVTEYMIRHEGKPGYDLLGWYQYTIEGKLYHVKRLEIEVDLKIEAIAIFRNDKGEDIALAEGVDVHRSGMALGSYGYEDEEGSYRAEIEETDDAWQGYPYNKETGFVENYKVKLPKDKWKKIVSPGDNIVGLHIPRSGKLSPELVDEAIDEAKIFLEKYFPDYDYKCFHCASWLCNPVLVEILGEDKNISKFCKRFNPFTLKSDGLSVFYFVYLMDDNESILDNLDQLPENTSLERALKEYYKSGKVIHGMGGYFFA